jgi:SAM-dependent methyltransferase
MVDVVTKTVGLIDVASMRGLEIGALHSPRLRRDQANIRYLDHATKDQLREKYANNPLAAPYADALVDVDYVWSPGRSLRDIVGDDAPFDFVIASHVIEHIPDPVGWLRQLGGILRVGGILSLVVPDQRYCFDANRQLTTAADLIDAYLREIEVPTYRQVYDHESNFLGAVDANVLWRGLDVRGHRRADVEDADRFALERCLELRDTGVYQDVHCSTFTPWSFLKLFAILVRLDLLDFRILAFYPTEHNDYEFFVTLERLDTSVRGPVLRDAQLCSIPPLDDDESAKPAGKGTLTAAVSPREEQLLQLKRRCMAALRGTWLRARRLLEMVR